MCYFFIIGKTNVISKVEMPIDTAKEYVNEFGIYPFRIGFLTKLEGRNRAENWISALLPSILTPLGILRGQETPGLRSP